MKWMEEEGEKDVLSKREKGLEEYFQREHDNYLGHIVRQLVRQ